MKFVHAITKDELVLQGLLSEPKQKTSEVVLHIHGMSGNFWQNSFIKTMLAEYPKNNISFLTAQNRGEGHLTFINTVDGSPKLIGNSYELFEDCVHDIEAWVTYLKEQGYETIHLQGHSLGCSKIAYYQSQTQDDRISCHSYISPADMMGLNLHESSIEEYRRYKEMAEELIAEGKPEELLPGYYQGFLKLSARSALNFSTDNDNLAIFNYYNPERGFQTLKSIRVPVISFLGTKDDGIVTNAYESSKLLDKHLHNHTGIVFEEAEHSFKGFEKQIVDETLRFIEKNRPEQLQNKCR